MMKKLIERLDVLYDEASDTDAVTIRDAMNLIEFYDDVLLVIAGTSPDYPSSMLIQYAKTAITQGSLQFNQPGKEIEP